MIIRHLTTCAALIIMFVESGLRILRNKIYLQVTNYLIYNLNHIFFNL